MKGRDGLLIPFGMMIPLGMAAAHGAGTYFLRSADWKRHLGGALCLLGTIVFGAMFGVD